MTLPPPDGVCGMCGQQGSSYCHNADGTLRPLCAEYERCGEHASPSYGDRCRDCGIQHELDEMQCSGCQRMRYTHDEQLGRIAAGLWGERCACDPAPPSVYDDRNPTPPRGSTP